MWNTVPNKKKKLPNQYNGATWTVIWIHFQIGLDDIERYLRGLAILLTSGKKIGAIISSAYISLPCGNSSNCVYTALILLKYCLVSKPLESPNST